MINFATLQGLTIPEGVVTQITDASGRVLWAVKNGKPIVLEVEKVTSDTYVGSSTYTSEKFILLDIYPKTNGKVKVTYGGLTKTVTDTSGAEQPNALEVYFGTYGGKADSVATPDKGTLTIEGDYDAVAIGTYLKEKSGTTQYCGCVYNIVDLGDISYIPSRAFFRTETNGPITGIPSTRRVVIPPNVTSIGVFAFNYQYKEGSSTLSLIYLEELVMLPTTPPTLAQADMPYFDTFKISVPAGCGEAYKTAEYWSAHADRIVEAS